MLKNLFKINSKKIDTNVLRKDYHIPEKINLKLTAKDGYFVITSPDLPGLITQAKNFDEMLDMLNDAILTYFDIPENECDFVMDKICIEGVGTISLKNNL